MPTAFNGAAPLAKIFFWIFIILVVLMLLRCGRAAARPIAASGEHLRHASQEYQSCLDSQRSGSGFRTGGGAFGGFSSGGGHK